VSQVSLEFELGQVHAVIGTNGAGKSHADQHAVGRDARRRPAWCTLEGRDVTDWTAAEARARRSWAAATSARRSYPTFSVFENCRLSRAGRALRSRGRWWQEPAARAATPAATIARVPPGEGAGLTDMARAHGRFCCQPRPASASSRSRCAWPPTPKVLLLDEPLAGMGAEETDRMLELLARAEARVTRSCSWNTTWTPSSASPTASRSWSTASVIASRTRTGRRSAPTRDVQIAYLGGH
jgi:branched-chain amino acid transport system ATP-binding protein